MHNVGKNTAPLILQWVVCMVTIEILRIKQRQKIVMTKCKPYGFHLQGLEV